MHAYRTHNCADLRASRRRLDRPPVGLDPPQARPWRRAVRRPARPLRPDPDRRRAPAARRCKILDALRVESVVTITGEVVAREGGGGEPEARRPARSKSSRARSTVQSAAAELPMPVAGEADYPEDIRLKYRYLDLRRERLHAQHHAALGGHRLDPPADDRPGLHRVPDADPDRLEPRRRARLSGPEPRPSGQILRAPAGAADVQAADHGRRLRPLFPDRALLPRRGCPRRPLARANSTSSISR